MIDDDRVNKLLNMLGDSPEKVADTLRKKNIKGRIGSRSSCPIANYLHRYHPGRVSVSQLMARFYEKSGGTERQMQIYLPDQLRDFVGRFDAGEYPDLIEWNSAYRDMNVQVSVNDQ